MEVGGAGVVTKDKGGGRGGEEGRQSGKTGDDA